MPEVSKPENSLRRAQCAIDRAPNPVYWIASDGSFLYVNESVCRSLGYGREELLRMTVFDIDPQIARAQFADFWNTSRIQGKYVGETTHKARDGRILPVEISVCRVDSEGEEFLCAFVKDISDRKRSEAALQETAERLRLALMAANQGLYDLNVQTGEAKVSPEYALMLGYDPAHFRETNAWWLERTHPDDRERVTVNYQAYIRGDIPDYSVECRQRTRSGDWKWILSLGKIVTRDAAGLPLRMLGTHTDITERKKAEAALQESEYFLRKSQEMARLGSYKMDVASGIWISSRTLDDIFGIDEGYPRDVEGWLEIIVPEQRDEMRRYLERHVLLECNRFEKEYRIIRRNDRQERWVFGIGELELDERGNSVRMIGTIQDITERKRAEKEREALEELLRHAQKMESVGRLAGGVAHDFNNMLAVILGYSELMRMRLPAGDPLLKYVLEIEKAGNHSRDITRQLLAFSRKQVIAPKDVNLNDLLTVMQKTLARLIGEDIVLRFHFGENLWTVRVDPAQFDQVLVNLALNARDAMPGGGKLTIETGNMRLDGSSPQGDGFTPGDYVYLRVSDEGVGMDRETLSHVFEPFFTTKEVGKGTGLGLSTVYGIVKQNGGFINVSSEPGKGTTFKIYIPRLPDAREAGGISDGTEETYTEAYGGTILLVEDDEMVRRMTSQMLEEMGYAVLVANDPFDALSLCAEKDLSLDLLITDVVMPGMNGHELWKNAEAVRPGIGVLLMSGYSADVIVHRGILEEGGHFLNKPFTRNELARAVREAIERR
jgi:PAS domain S-box-containing protein